MENPKNPLIPVTMLQGWGVYATGEVAGFDQKTVDQLLKKGIAELFDSVEEVDPEPQANEVDPEPKPSGRSGKGR